MNFIMMAVLLLGATYTEDDRVAFFKAIGSNQVDAVRAALDKDPTLAEAKTKDGRSAAMAALFIGTKQGFVGRRSNAILEMLLARQTSRDVFDVVAFGTAEALEERIQADPAATTAPNPFGWAPLHLAAFAGNTATTEVLLRHGAVIDGRAKTRFKNTPLQTALLTGEIGTARLLLDHGADVLVRQNGGFAPIHEAALLGRVDLIELLLDRGAELNARANDGRTALSEAIRGGHEETAAFLRAKNANPGTITADLMKEPKD
jgi:ankyrin repeat protein